MGGYAANSLLGYGPVYDGPPGWLDAQCLKLGAELLHAFAFGVGLKGGLVVVDLVDHNCRVVVVRQRDVELDRAGLAGQAAIAVCYEAGQHLSPVLAAVVLDRRENCVGQELTPSMALARRPKFDSRGFRVHKPSTISPYHSSTAPLK